MLFNIAAVVLAMQVVSQATPPNKSKPSVQEIQYRVQCILRHVVIVGTSAPGMECAIQAVTSYPIPCGHGADVDIRDGQCYPNGTVPPQFQEGRQRPRYYRY